MKLVIGAVIIFFNFQVFATQKTVQCEVGEFSVTSASESREIYFNALLGVGGVGTFTDLVFNDVELFEAGAATQSPLGEAKVTMSSGAPFWDVQMVLNTDGDEESNAIFYLKEAPVEMKGSLEPGMTLYTGTTLYYGGTDGKQLKVAPEAYCLVSVD